MLAGSRFHHRFDSGGQHRRSPLPDRIPIPVSDHQRDHIVENGQRHASRQRCSFLGFEMDTELVWTNWDLGKEFTKTLIIKNTLPKLQRILFRPPLSKYFTSLARQKIVLSPGTSFSIPVTFKPLKRCDYEDTIEFWARNNSFHVPLKAPAPCHTIEVSESVLMPLCAVQHSIQTTFRLKNVSKLTTFFHWEYSPPFMLSPDQGHLKPDQELNITVAFHPQEALIHKQTVSCRFGTRADHLEGCCSVLLQGVAKHPYLELKTLTNHKGIDHVPVLNFGGAAVGQTLHNHFEIYNPSPFSVCFTVSRLPGSGTHMLDSVFGCDLTSAEVAPGAALKATVSFTPTTVDSTSVEYLSLICRGAINKSLLKLNGSCIGPQVFLSSPVVDFGVVEPGQAVTHTVELVNSSLAEAVFQWDIDCSGHSVFCIQPAGGTVPPQGHITLNVTYKPSQSLLHYRRVACLILHREPVFLNLVGNCHSEKPFHQLLFETSNIHETDQEQNRVALVAVTPTSEYVLSCLGGNDPLSPASPLLSIVPHELVFNQKLYSLPENLTSQKPITVTNHCKVKLRLEWTAASDSSFSVSPLFCELPPLKSTSFRVSYCPKQLNSLHGAQLECFAFPVAEFNGSVLPSCVTVRVIGHSFEPGKKHSVPQCSLEPRLVDFPPVNVASYRSVLLLNKGDLPLTFHLNPDRDQELAEAASLVVVPSCGLISPQSHQIFSVRTIPSENSPKEGFNVQLDLNASKYTKKLAIFSKSERPCVSLENDGKLHFHPTAVYSLTQHLYQIRNLSRQALRFQWRIPEQDQGLISVEPGAGVLHPNESLVQMWSFTPVEEKTYTFIPNLTISPMHFPDCDNLHLPLVVTGQGCVGYIQAKEAVLEVKDVLIGGCKTISVPVINNSPCTVSFCVRVEQKLLDKGVDQSNVDQCALQVHNESVTIASKSTILLQSTFTPHQKAQYIWTISYQTINANGSLSSAKLLCEVRAKGVYPTLQITDICGRGSLSRFSKKHLWRLLSLNHLNELLQFSPCPAELTYSTPTRHSLYPTPSVFTKATVDFNFSAAPLNSDPSTFMLMLYNPGIIPVEWTFLFPKDQQLDLEFWAETGEFSSTELYQMKVQDSHLFSVTPRSGKLMAGQQRAVTFTYSHDFPGTDRFPVLLKISYGREIMLTFQGITVEMERPYLHFASNTHIFASVAIGDYNPPKQKYQLHNQGAVPVQYEVDKAVFSQIQEENFNHPVLRCLNPSGQIPPGEAAILEWIFSPLEAKFYQMDIPIRILNGESTTIRFEGCGKKSLMQSLSSSSDCTDDHLLPCWQRKPFPEQPTFLSEDSVDFGDIVVSSKSSKMLFLNNNSHNEIVFFEWVLPQQNNQQQVLDIIPSRGRLSPGEILQCVLTFFASEYPTNYQFDIICKVTSEAALRLYSNAVQQMEEEKERLKHEFTITDKTPKENTVVLTENKAEAVALWQQAYVNKYKTLPPIRGTNDCNTVQSLSSTVSRAQRRALREFAKVQKDPEPPKPRLLHLSVTAQSRGLREFLTQAPDRLKSQYRPNQMDKTQSQIMYIKKSSTAQGLKKDMSAHVFTSLLRDILEDAAFVDDLLPLASKPDVYNPTPASCPSSKRASSDKTEPQKIDEENARVSEDGAGNVKPVRPELADLTEEICLLTLQNLMVEVIRGELDPTVHPRTVILPSSARNRTTPRNLADDGTENMD